MRTKNCDSSISGKIERILGTVRQTLSYHSSGFSKFGLPI